MFAVVRARVDCDDGRGEMDSREDEQGLLESDQSSACYYLFIIFDNTDNFYMNWIDQSIF